MTSIVPVVCPGCNNPIYDKNADAMILCPNCGMLHTRDGKVTIVEYEAGARTKHSDGEAVYLPFWKVGVDFRIRSERVEGGAVSRFVGFLSGSSNAGHVGMFLPAFEIDPARYKDLAEKLTLGQPGYALEKITPGLRREPCTIGADMTDELADFLFVTIEAEKPGVMQQLDYDLRVTSKKFVYLPYFKKGNDLVPGF